MVFRLILLAASAAVAQSNLFFFLTPPREMFQDSTARFVISTNPPGGKLSDSCALYRSPSPLGATSKGRALVTAPAKLATDSGSVSLSFKPADKDPATGGQVLALGIHYLVAACRDGKDVTPEFPLKVVTRQSPSFLSPKSLETSASPTV